MALPFFYKEEISSNNIQLDEDSSKHVVQVLRMQKGEKLLLTDGKGNKAETVIADDNRKRCVVQVLSRQSEPVPAKKTSIAISLLKNATRFEWFLEKATELGISEIIPLLCERTEKEKFRYERLQQILISAMLQSQQCWLPVLHQPTNFSTLLSIPFGQKLIAHCLPGEKKPMLTTLQAPSSNPQHLQSFNRIVLIGPEGDFSVAEVDAALQHGFQPVSLGHSRLRTETAGMVAATLLQQQQLT